MPVSRPLDDQAFDRWVRLCLRERHQAVMREPMPDALLKLLQNDRP